MKVDELVVDSTYGSPASVRLYSQVEAESYLLEVISQALHRRSVHVKAHRGTIERVLHVVAGEVCVPILASARLIADVDVYRDHGFRRGAIGGAGLRRRARPAE